MTQILQWAYFRIETACWQNRRPTHMCSEPVEGWHVASRGGDSGGKKRKCLHCVKIRTFHKQIF
jgi:hypothetical protein